MIAPVNGFKFVGTPGTPEQLVPQPYVLQFVEIYPYSGNTGTVYVGGSYVSAASGNESGFPLASGKRITVNPFLFGDTELDLSKFWMDVTTADDGVYWVGWQRVS